MSVAERREARRRRILENLDNRLQKITGVSTNFENEDRTYNCESQFLTSTPMLNENKEESCTQYQDQFEASAPFSYTLNQDDPVEPEISIIQNLLFNIELQIITLAVVSYILLRYKAGLLGYESLMIPFYTMELLQVSFRHSDESNFASVLVTMLGMYGISNRLITATAKLLVLAIGFQKDICLYLFVIIWTTKVLE